MLSSSKKKTGLFQSRSSASGQIRASLANGKPLTSEHYISASFIASQGGKGVRVFPESKFKFQGSFHQAGAQTQNTTAQKIRNTLPEKPVEPVLTAPSRDSEGYFEHETGSNPFQKAENCLS